MSDQCEAAWEADTTKGGAMARFRNEPCRHNDADRGIYGGAGCGVHFHCMECGGYWEEGVDETREGRRRFSEWYAERKVAEAVQIMQEHEVRHRDQIREWSRLIRFDQAGWVERVREAQKAAGGVESVSVDDEIDRGNAAAADRSWTPVIENFEPEGRVFGSVETQLANRRGVGSLKMEFNGLIYQECGNVMQVTVEDGHNITTVFIKPDDLLAAVQWMNRLHPVGEED